MQFCFKKELYASPLPSTTIRTILFENEHRWKS